MNIVSENTMTSITRNIYLRLVKACLIILAKTTI